MIADSEIPENARRRAVRGTFAYITRQVIVMGIGAVVNLALMFLLQPIDFGYIASVNVLLNIIRLLSTGIGVHLVQRKDVINDDDLSAVLSLEFCLYLVLQGLLTIGFLASQFFASSTYLWLLLWVTGFALPFGLLRSGSMILLERRLDYVKMAGVDVAEQVIFAIVQLAVVLVNGGAWCVVIAALISYIVGWQVAKRLAPYQLHFQKPRFDDKLRRAIIFGFNFHLPNIIGVMRGAALPVIVGGALGMQAVGYIERASFIVNLPLAVLASVKQKILFSYTARIQADRSMVRRLFEVVLYFSSSMDKVLFLPLLVFGADIMRIFFSEKWLPCVPLMNIFILGIIFTGAFSGTAHPILTGLGKAGLIAIASVLVTVMTWGLLLPFVNIFGIIGYAYHNLLLILPGIYFYFIIRKQLGRPEIWPAITYPMIAFGLGCGVAWLSAVLLFQGAQTLLSIGVASCLGILAYAAILLVLDKNRIVTIALLLKNNLKTDERYSGVNNEK